MDNSLNRVNEPVRVEIVQPLESGTGDDLGWLAKIAILVASLAVAVFSIFVVADYASSPENHASTIEVLNEKQGNAIGLAAAAAGASTLASMLPDDFADAVSEELAGLSSDFAVVVMAILLEKYLLTVLGLVSFKALVPVSCLLLVVGAFSRRLRTSMFSNAAKIFVAALVLFAIVPISAHLSAVIDETHDTAALISAPVEQVDVEAEIASEEDDRGFWEKLVSVPADAAGAVTEVATDAVDYAAGQFNGLLEAFAVMVVTTCVIPILVAFVALWAVGAIFKVDVSKPMGMLKGRAWRSTATSARRQIKDRVAKGQEG